MNINQVQSAVSVWKYGSFSKAAAKANVSQSAISQQVAKLEEELSFQIFDRHSKSLQPTEKGLLFLQESQDALRQFTQLDEFAKNLGENFSENLNVGIIPTLSSYLVSLFINDFTEKNPHLSLSIFEKQTEEIIEGLMNRSLDTGIIATPIKSKINFERKILFYEKFFVYSAKEYPFFVQEDVVIDESCYNDMWLLQEGNCFANQVINICESQQVFKQNLHYACNSIESLRRIVDYRGGFTFIPELATLNISSEEENKIKNIQGPDFAREISIIYFKNEPKQKLIGSLRQSIRANLPSTMLNKKSKKIVPTNVVIA